MAYTYVLYLQPTCAYRAISNETKCCCLQYSTAHSTVKAVYILQPSCTVLQPALYMYLQPSCTVLQPAKYS